MHWSNVVYVKMRKCNDPSMMVRYHWSAVKAATGRPVLG